MVAVAAGELHREFSSISSMSFEALSHLRSVVEAFSRRDFRFRPLLSVLAVHLDSACIFHWLYLPTARLLSAGRTSACQCRLRITFICTAGRGNLELLQILCKAAEKARGRVQLQTLLSSGFSRGDSALMCACSFG